MATCSYRPTDAGGGGAGGRIGVALFIDRAASAGVSELLFAGFLNHGGIELVPCKTIDLQVPANAEIVIEGHVSTDCGPIGYDPREVGPDGQQVEIGEGAAFEGPFGDHTGFYSLPDRYPVSP